MSTGHGKSTAARKSAGHASAGRAKTTVVHPASASQIRRALKVTKEQFATARALIANIRPSRSKAG